MAKVVDDMTGSPESLPYNDLIDRGTKCGILTLLHTCSGLLSSDSSPLIAVLWHIQGYNDFTSSIRRVFMLPRDSELNITFTCDDPLSGRFILYLLLLIHCCNQF